MGYHVYIGGFSSWGDVNENFKINLPEPDNVFAFYDYQGGDGNAEVFFEREGIWKYAEGCHCSYYGLEGQWKEEDFDPSVYLEAIRQGKNTNPLGDKDVDAEFREFLELATGAEA